MPEKTEVLLPARCAACVYRSAASSFCQRHAPQPAEDEFELAHWPRVRPTDRCGAGASVTDGSGPSIVRCETCIHWLQPGDEPIRPDYRKGLPAEWWEKSGICTRFAPGPSSDEERRVFWRVTHATAGCGDGQAVSLREEEHQAPVCNVSKTR
jgi:hypothetical protein